MTLTIRRNQWLIGLFLTSIFALEVSGQEQNGGLEPSVPRSEPARQDQTGMLAEGEHAPAISFVGLDGKTLETSQWTDQGKSVVLIFSRAHW